MKTKQSSSVAIFVGALLVVIFVVGIVCSRNPGAFIQKNRYDITLEQFCAFCADWWIPAGIIGIPTLIGSLILTLVREARDKKNQS